MQGTYSVARKVNEVGYVINAPNRRKAQRLCHVNMIKPYVERAESVEHPATRTVPVLVVEKGSVVVPSEYEVASDNMKLKNSDVLANLETKLCHLSYSQQLQLSALIEKFTNVFPDVPGQTTLVSHDVDVGDSRAIKQHPYRINPVKLEAMKKEIDYM